MKVSVIIPVYNVEAYLRECLDSVLAQSHDNLEVLLSDDGSTDGSGTMCDRYAAADARVRVIHAPNGGLSVARNRALEIASGECVFFVDSDDAVHPRAVEILLKAIVEHDADAAWSAYTRNPDRLSDRPHHSESVDGSTATELFLYQRGIFCHGIGGMMLRRRGGSAIRFREGICYEDLDFLAPYLAEARRVVTCDAPLYFYRSNAGGLTGEWHPGRTDVLDVTARIEEAFKHHARLRPAAGERRMSAAFNIFLLNARHGNDPALAEACFGIIRGRRRRSLFNRRVRFKSKAGALLSYMGPRVLAFIGRL